MISRQKTPGNATTLANGSASDTAFNSLLQEEDEWRRYKSIACKSPKSIYKTSNVFLKTRGVFGISFKIQCGCPLRTWEVNKSLWYIYPWRHYHILRRVIYSRMISRQKTPGMQALANGSASGAAINSLLQEEEE
ncbi:hypothetical protein CEXT_650981 [Caerostris extrusa]|uniref:Uncharacterized protein n=1 Tax=Caerostris extrusa TaxID=172846 RepID=A0AAV4Y0Y5_CAEEX|nr:hypothetical protein CEXT_650981 [Caerostris extrusa]